MCHMEVVGRGQMHVYLGMSAVAVEAGIHKH